MRIGGLLPDTWRRRLRRWRHPVRFGTLRRVRPLSDHWGRDRGTPIDRWYIDRFLELHAADIRGRGLEVRDPGYLERFGMSLTSVDVLDLDPSNPRATILADLAERGALPNGRFDVIVLTQVLQYVSDPAIAIENLRNALVPGGVLLVTVPCIGRIGRSDLDIDRWRFTAVGLSSLLTASFDPGDVAVSSHGNVLSATAFIAGAAAEDLRPDELAADDPCFPIVVAARAHRD